MSKFLDVLERIRDGVSAPLGFGATRAEKLPGIALVGLVSGSHAKGIKVAADAAAGAVLVAGAKGAGRGVRLDGRAPGSRGAVITVEVFAQGDVSGVDVIGTTKGKGFAGVMARNGFGGKEASHGVERKHRSPGSIG